MTAGFAGIDCATFGLAGGLVLSIAKPKTLAKQQGVRAADIPGEDLARPELFCHPFV
jgi:hypothetical protein